MRKILLFFIFFSFTSLQASGNFYFFIPPKDWKIVDPKKVPEFVKIGFVSSSKKPFKPSLNLVTETSNASFNEFVASVKKHHLNSRKNRWYEIGFVETKAGKGHVSQIDTKTECGDIRTMQCIIKGNEVFYIITAVALRDEFIDYHNEFLTSFESFTITKTAEDALHSKELKTKYQGELKKLEKGFDQVLFSSKNPKNKENSFLERKFQKKHWKAYEKALVKSFGEMGTFWQVMAASEAKNRLIATSQQEK